MAEGEREGMRERAIASSIEGEGGGGGEQLFGTTVRNVEHLAVIIACLTICSYKLEREGEKGGRKEGEKNLYIETVWRYGEKETRKRESEKE